MNLPLNKTIKPILVYMNLIVIHITVFKISNNLYHMYDKLYDWLSLLVVLLYSTIKSGVGFFVTYLVTNIFYISLVTLDLPRNKSYVPQPRFDTTSLLIIPGDKTNLLNLLSIEYQLNAGKCV